MRAGGKRSVRELDRKPIKVLHPVRLVAFLDVVRWGSLGPLRLTSYEKLIATTLAKMSDSFEIKAVRWRPTLQDDRLSCILRRFCRNVPATIRLITLKSTNRLT